MPAAQSRPDSRVPWIDFSRGLAVLLVIIGHCVGFDCLAGDIVRGLIYSFHMPFFFIIGALCYRWSRSPEELFRKTEKNFRQLIVPAVILFALLTLSNLLKGAPPLGRMHYLLEQVNAFVYSSGVEVQVLGATIPYVGLLWFLTALFLGRFLFDYLQLKLKKQHLLPVLLLLCLIGYLLGRFQWLPLSFDIVLVTMPFFYLGDSLKKRNMERHALLNCFLFLILWLGMLFAYHAISGKYLELAPRRYPLFPVSLLAAAAGTLFFSYGSVLIGGLKCMAPFRYIGKNALPMIWVQALDHGWEFCWKVSQNNFLNALLRIAADWLVFLILMQVIYLIRQKRAGHLSKKPRQPFSMSE